MDQDKLHHTSQSENSIVWKIALLGRLRLWFLARTHSIRLLSSIYILSATICSMAVLGLASAFVSWKLIFPSIGPTMFLQFYNPGLAVSSPRNTVSGHIIGALTGIFFCYIGHSLGLCEDSFFRILLMGLGLGVAGTIMAFTGLVHPPAASTALIAMSGIDGSWEAGAVVVLSSILVSIISWCMHRLAGVRFPLWSPFEQYKGPRMETRLGVQQDNDIGHRGRKGDAAAAVAEQLRSGRRV